MLASFPKLVTAGAQYTIAEQDNVRYVFQPLEELYLVLITNRQSNVLQDIDSLHLFAQVVSSICKSSDEREIQRHAFELLSAFDEVVNFGYREHLTMSQIKTFLDMESHEERIQEIIARNKELEASEERKRKAKQLEMQRKEMARNARTMGGMPRAPSYNPPTVPTTVPDTYDSYNEAKKATKALPTRGKGMQLGKKSKTGSAFDQIRGELGPEAEIPSPVSPVVSHVPATTATIPARVSLSHDREPIHVTVNEAITAKLSREGSLERFEVKGDLQLRITDSSLTQVKLNLALGDIRGATLTSHPKMDKNLFRTQKVIQVAESGKGFPANQSIGVMRWKLTPKPSDIDDPPITFTVWVNDAGGHTWNITVEYEWKGPDLLKDVSVTIPYATSEPAVSSFDAVYEVSGDSIDWTIGAVDESNANGQFEFEAQAADEGEFFPMSVHFAKTKPFVDIDVSYVVAVIDGANTNQVESVSLLSEGQDINFSKDVKSVADDYTIG